MKIFLSLIKWRSKENFHTLSRYGIKGLTVIITTFVLLFFLAVPFVFYLTEIFVPSFQKIASLSGQLEELVGIDFERIIISFLSSIIFIIMLGSELPVTISNLFFSERLQFLITTPVKTTTFFKVQLLEVLATGGLPITLFVPVFLSALYGLGFVGTHFWISILLLLIYILFILAVTTMISFGIVFIARGRFMKVISTFMTGITLLAFVFTLRLMDFSAIDIAQPLEVAEKLKNLQTLVTQKHLPWSPFVNALTGGLKERVLFLGYTGLVFVALEVLNATLYRKTLNRLWSSSQGKNTARGFRGLYMPLPFLGFLRKDLLLILREPKLAFAFLYPTFFIPAIVLTNPSLLKGGGILQLLSLLIFLICNYTTISSTAIFAFERQVGDYNAALPRKAIKPVLSKALTITFIYLLIIFGINQYLKIKIPSISNFLRLFTPFMIPTIFVLTLVGGTLEKHHGTGESKNVFKALTITGAIISFLFSSVIPLFTSLPLTLYVTDSLGTFLKFLRIPETSLMKILFGIFFPIVLWVISAWWSLKILCYNED